MVSLSLGPSVSSIIRGANQFAFLGTRSISDSPDALSLFVLYSAFVPYSRFITGNAALELRSPEVAVAPGTLTAPAAQLLLERWAFESAPGEGRQRLVAI